MNVQIDILPLQEREGMLFVLCVWNAYNVWT